ncbi:uncharacterized protein LOC144107026 [Amblyomma americanum]
MLKDRKYAIFERLAGGTAWLLAAADRVRRSAKPHSPDHHSCRVSAVQEIIKKSMPLPRFSSAATGFLNHVVRFGARHWPPCAYMWRSLLAGSMLRRGTLQCDDREPTQSSVMDEAGSSKRSHRAVKHRSIHKYRGRRRKSKVKARPATTRSAAIRPSGVGPDANHPSVSDASGEFGAAIEYVSASEKKIGYFQGEERACDEASSVLIDLTALNILVSGAICPTCQRSGLRVREPAAKRKGLASFLELLCENCACPQSVLSATYTSRRVVTCSDASNNASRDYDGGSSRESFAVNVKAAVAARSIGMGYDQLVRFTAIIGLHKPMHHKSFAAINRKVHDAAMSAVSENLEKSRAITKSDVGGDNIAVMFDGTWQKRGHKSHNGIGTVISLDTGLCLDFEVLSNYCLACSRHRVLPDEEEEVWQAFHGPVCEKNVDCSSNAMETEAAVRIWQRSRSYDTPLHFRKFLSDGDSKAYAAVVEANAYSGVPIEKEDCTNHVAKRLGTALRKLKEPLPRGEKLKEPAILKLQTYYQVAITSNRGSVQGMYRAIWASYFHSCSSDGASSHKFCPEGAASWCKHRRAEAMGERAPAHTPLLTKAQGKAILPIYKRLTDEKLLARCIQGKTQNASESLNSKIWLLCPKTRFASRYVVETATALAVLWFNRGHTSFDRVLEELGVLPPVGLVELGTSRDTTRQEKMSLKLTAEARANRRTLKKKRMSRSPLARAVRGRRMLQDVSSGSGCFRDNLLPLCQSLIEIEALFSK